MYHDDRALAVTVDLWRQIIPLCGEHGIVPVRKKARAHQRGVGVCGVYPYEIAETKVNQVMDFARQNQHPLQCTLEKA